VKKDIVAVKKVIVSEVFHGMEKIHSSHEHHSATVNVVVLLNHATCGGTLQRFPSSIIET